MRFGDEPNYHCYPIETLTSQDFVFPCDRISTLVKAFIKSDENELIKLGDKIKATAESNKYYSAEDIDYQFSDHGTILITSGSDTYPDHIKRFISICLQFSQKLSDLGCMPPEFLTRRFKLAMYEFASTIACGPRLEKYDFGEPEYSPIIALDEKYRHAVAIGNILHPWIETDFPVCFVPSACEDFITYELWNELNVLRSVLEITTNRITNNPNQKFVLDSYTERIDPTGEKLWQELQLWFVTYSPRSE